MLMLRTDLPRFPELLLGLFPFATRITKLKAHPLSRVFRELDPLFR